MEAPPPDGAPVPASADSPGRRRVRKRVRRPAHPERATAATGALIPRLFGAPAAVLSAALCLFLAVHHPTLGAASLVPLAAAAGVAMAFPGAWPLWLLPLLPLAGFMPWTGWLTVEELDLLVLAAGAGGYARWTVSGAPAAARAGTPGTVLGTGVLAAAVLSLGVSMLRGVADAGGWAAGWWQGFHEPLNAVRLAKSLPAVLWLMPLWLRDHDRQPERGADRMLLGVTGMLASIGLTVLWERLAFTGLTDFSTDYRATGLFWEMHVGGAALDAALTAAFPFAVLTLLRARTPLQAGLAGVAIVLGSYAALVTFSRVVYVGVPLGVAAMALLWLRRPGTARRAFGVTTAAATAALAAGFALAGVTVFPAGGYRGLAAVLGVFALLPAVLAALRGAPLSLVAGGLGAGMLAAGVAWGAHALLPKGAYLGYGVLAAATAAAALAGLRSAGTRSAHVAGGLGLAGLLGLCAGIVMVTAHWGGPAASATALPVAAGAVCLVAGTALARRSPWPASPVGLGTVAGGLLLVAVVIGVFSGGRYMGDRLATLQEDAAFRSSHATRALALRHGPGDTWFGRGLGRYVASQFMSGRAEDQTGTVFWRDTGDGHAMLLTSGKHLLGWGEIFRVSQRVDPPGPGATVRARIRATAPVDLHAEVCEKHLLYNGACLVGLLKLADGASDWRTVEWTLHGEAPPTRGTPFAPRLIAFSLALGTPAGAVEFAALELRDAEGAPLLRNGEFRDGGAHWFFTSDRHHMPWHAKNAAIHLLVEQGWLGLAVLGLGAGLLLWRAVLGSLRAHPLAPALVGALAGLVTVGTGDSLFDMPRIAFLVWLVLATGLLLRPAETRGP